MSNTTNIILVAALIIIIGVAGYFFYNQNVEVAELNSNRTVLDISSCEKDDNKYLCLVGLALYNQDPSLCEQAASLDERDYNDKTFIWGECYHRIAVEKKDLKVCDMIDNDVYKDSCYVEVYVEIGDPAACENTPHSIIPTNPEANLERDDCYSGIARKTVNVQLCEKVVNEHNKDLCHQSIGIMKNDIAICNKIINFEFKGGCYLRVARSTNDIKLCDGLTFYPNYQDACYQIMAQTFKDPLICDKIASDYYKKSCHTEIDKQ